MNNSDNAQATAKAFAELMQLIRDLRSENGCPWDKKQTPQTFHPYILEEYHEMVHALNNGASADVADEMGDLLFLVVFVAYMFEQEGLATISEIIRGVVEKMTRRHPHVFGEVEVNTPQEVIDQWSRIKASEENIQQRESMLDGVPRSLPALSRAQKLARRAAKTGFDWTKADEVFPKIDEELAELREAVATGTPAEKREELGDLLFVITNAARHLEINSEAALNETSDKFERRFRYIETQLRARGRSMEEATLEEMDALWDEAKALEKGRAAGQ